MREVALSLAKEMRYSCKSGEMRRDKIFDRLPVNILLNMFPQPYDKNRSSMRKQIVRNGLSGSQIDILKWVSISIMKRELEHKWGLKWDYLL